jgi:hypothetical protein
LVADLQPLVVGLQEIWTKHDYMDWNLSEYGAPICSCRKNSKGGGVGLYLHQSVKGTVRADLEIFVEGTYESQAIDVTGPRGNFSVINIYRPPQGDPRTAVALLDRQLEQLNGSAGRAYVIGDLNIDGLADSSGKTRLWEAIESNGFCNLATGATRIGSRKNSQIDYFLSKGGDRLALEVLDPALSDHCALLARKVTERPDDRNMTTRTPGIVMSTRNIATLKAKIGALDWQTWISKADSLSVDAACAAFQNTITQEIRAACLTSTAPVTRKKAAPWFNSRVLKQKQLLLNKALAKARTSRDNRARYTECRRDYQSALRKARSSYFKNKLEEANADPRKIWEVINEATGRTVARASIGDMDFGQGLMEDRASIATKMNDFFATIGERLAANIPVGVPFHDYAPAITPPRVHFSEITELRVVEIIKKLKPKRSASCDLISNMILKSLAEEILSPLTYILNRIFQEAKMPHCLKRARVVLIHKGGTKTDPNNWRPISILSGIGKICEVVLNNLVMKHMTDCNLWYPKQFGFRKNHSTSHAVAQLVLLAQKQLEKKRLVLIVLLDVAKAFNCLPPHILLEKLRWYGMGEDIIQFVRSYLANREQVTDLGDICSGTAEVNLGTPQGGAFSTTAYITFNNDIHRATEAEVILFADDTSLILSSDNMQDLTLAGNTELAKVSAWFAANGLTLNSSKTKAIILGSSARAKENVNLYLDGHPVAILGDGETTKFLGVTLSGNLDFKHQAAAVASKVRRGIFALAQAKNVLPRQARRLVFHALVQSHFEYACETWVPMLRPVQLHQLLLLQKKAIRLTESLQYRAHTALVMKDAGFLGVGDLANLHLQLWHVAWRGGSLPGSLVHELSGSDESRCSSRLASKTRRINTQAAGTLVNLVLAQDPGPEVQGKSYGQARKLLKDRILNGYNTTCLNLDCRSCRPGV